MNLRILLIIPAFNEEKSIVAALCHVINSKYDYIVINDGSVDQTAKILDEGNYNHIDLFYNLGIGGAMQTGYKYAEKHGYDIAVQYDADGQHDIKYIEKIIQPIIDDEADFVIGSRFINKSATNFTSTALRRLGIKLLSDTIKLFSKKRVYDVTSGFRAANKNIISKFAHDYPIEYPEPISDFELITQGFRIKEVQVSMNKRMDGKSSIHSWKSIYYMINVFISIILMQLRRKKNGAA